MGIDESEYNRLIIAEIDEESREEHAERMLNPASEIFRQGVIAADCRSAWDTYPLCSVTVTGRPKSLILEEETSKLFDEDEAIEMGIHAVG